MHMDGSLMKHFDHTRTRVCSWHLSSYVALCRRGRTQSSFEPLLESSFWVEKQKNEKAFSSNAHTLLAPDCRLARLSHD